MDVGKLLNYSASQFSSVKLSRLKEAMNDNTARGYLQQQQWARKSMRHSPGPLPPVLSQDRANATA